MYKLGKTHVIVNALSRLLNCTKLTSVLDQTIDASLFYTRFKWPNDVKDFFKTR